MISQTLIILIIILAIIGYIYQFILYLQNKDKKTNNTGSELALKLLNDDTEIKIVESKNKIFSTYSIKRNMIRLATKTYYGNDIFSGYVVSLLSGYELSKNKYIELISKVFKNIRVISISSLIICLLSIMTNNRFDSKLAIIINIFICLYQYLIYGIKTNIRDNNKDIEEKILSLFDKELLVDKIFFITSLISILRYIIIIFNI